jgi:hypothetical protein
MKEFARKNIQLNAVKITCQTDKMFPILNESYESVMK